MFMSGRSSRERYIEIFTAQFATLSRVELLVFQKFSSKCFGDWPWRLEFDLFESRKSHVLCKMGQFLNLFSFPSTFLIVHLLPYLKHSQTHRVTLKQTSILLHFILKYSRKWYEFSLSHYIFHVLSFVFLDL